MAISDKIPNQYNFQDYQNFEIDIEKIYTDFIEEIDKSRSLINIQTNQARLEIFDIKTIAGLNSRLEVSNTVQESRTHAFYRLIGFPIVNDAFEYYNPGFNSIEDDDLITITLTKEKIIDIANKIDNTDKSKTNGYFFDISSKRESNTNSMLSIFSVKPTTIKSSTLALTSVNTRSFAASIKGDDPFNYKIQDQSYTVDSRSLVGRNSAIMLYEYVDEFGAKETSKSLDANHYHIITPFMVDPRIDFSVNPSGRKFAVPFAPYKTNLLIGENTYVKRPAIEKIIRDRLSVRNTVATTGTAGERFSEYITSVPSVLNEEIIQLMAGNNQYKLGDQWQFKKYFDIIKTMCARLVKAQKEIKKVQSIYYWLPEPNSIGPEGGCDIKKIIVSKDFPSNLITTADKSIIDTVLIQATNQFNVDTADMDGTPDVGGFAFDAFSDDSTIKFENGKPATGDSATEQLDKNNKKRNQYLGAANDALRTIEIIMGEFGGLGLCDIVAIYAALYIMDIDCLFGFLDIDAFNRMHNEFNLGPNYIRKDIKDAHKELLKRVLDFYNLMDKIYTDLAQNNGLNV